MLFFECGLMPCDVLCSVSLPHGLWSVVMAFLGHTHFWTKGTSNK